MKGVNMKSKQNRKSNFQGVDVFSMQWDSVEASTKWRSCFPYVTTKGKFEGQRGTNWLLKGKMSEGKPDRCPCQWILKKLEAGVIWEGKLILKAHVLGTRCTVIELKAWDASRLDSSFWSSNSRKFMWEISSRQSLQRQISCFPTKFPS